MKNLSLLGTAVPPVRWDGSSYDLHGGAAGQGLALEYQLRGEIHFRRTHHHFGCRKQSCFPLVVVLQDLSKESTGTAETDWRLSNSWISLFLPRAFWKQRIRWINPDTSLDATWAPI